MPLYEYVCPACSSLGIPLEEHLKPGIITLFRPVDQRDNVVTCPACSLFMERPQFPHDFTTRWVSNKSAKRYPTVEGPSDNVYLRGEERKRKEARTASRKQFSLMTPEQDRFLKADAKRAPTQSEVPSPGVTVQKEQ